MITRRDIADKIVEIIQRDIDGNLRETHGRNRSPRIDYFNSRVNIPLGSPYCAAGAWSAIQDACDELGLKNPVKATGWSQSFSKKSFVPERYIRAGGSLGQKGDGVVFQSINDPSRGHFAILSEDQEDPPFFNTVEYNTDSGGSRDGDGAYAKIRSIHGDVSKIFVCFTDIPEWILNANKGE